MPDLRLGHAGRLPETWIPEVEVRLSLYGRLARLLDAEAIDAFEAELEDRFGTLPSDAAVLLDVCRVRAMARTLAIAKVDAGPAAIALTLRPNSHADVAAAGLVEKEGRYLLIEALPDGTQRVERCQEVLARMDQP